MSTRNDDPNKFELSNGITLTLRDASPMLMIAIREEADADEPKPPMITRQDRDGRQEPNEDDPDYQLAKAKWALNLGNRAIQVLAAACVTIDHVPEGIPVHDGDEWGAQVEDVYGLALEPNPTRRMVQWLFLQTNADDLAALGPRLLAKAGAEEVAVQDVLDSFRRYSQRPADSDGHTEGSRSDGDTVPPAIPRNRAQRRRKGGR